LISLKIIVKGRVQNVGFRYYTLSKAQDLKITGYTKNLPDNSVEIEAHGDAIQMNTFIDFLRIGPSAAIVSQIQTSEIPFQSFPSFEIIR
jgi:acylphosphatase